MFSCQKALQPTLNFPSQLNLSNLPISCPLVVKHALLEMPYRWFSHSKPSLPSGKRLHTYGKSPCYIFMDKSTISTGPFSIAFCMFTRPGIMDFWRLSWESMENTVKKSLHSEMHWGNHSDMSGNITETIHLWGESSHSNTISTMNVWWICLMEISWRYNG